MKKGCWDREAITVFQKAIRTLMIILLMPLLNIIMSSYLTHVHMKEITQTYNTEMDDISDSRWIFITGIIDENRSKAKMQSDSVRDKLESDLLLSYKDNLIQLKPDLDSSTTNNAFLIMGNAIHGKYLNVSNDNNDMFIATTDKVLVDNSINCSIAKDDRSWECEIPMHANPILARQSIKLLTQQSDYLKFWEFIEHPNSNHIKLEYPSMTGLKQVYDVEGIDGLSSYEFLTASYVRQGNKDIFDTPDVNFKGIKNNNYKLIVVQGFNIVDVLNKSYIDKLMYFSNLEIIAKHTADERRNQRVEELFMSIVIMLSSFIGLSVIIKLIVKWGGEDVSRGDN